MTSNPDSVLADGTQPSTERRPVLRRKWRFFATTTAAGSLALSLIAQGVSWFRFAHWRGYDSIGQSNPHFVVFSLLFLITLVPAAVAIASCFAMIGLREGRRVTSVAVIILNGALAVLSAIVWAASLFLVKAMANDY